ncbi:MAG: penicillin acylase family protein, partial [Acidobacteriales bacterium]|nr:penicillin acylase family protein [Terriglobales bacterium]
MATTTAPAIRRRVTPRLWFRLLLVAFFLIAVAALGLRAYLLRVERSALPQIDGTISAPGLSAPVAVARDEHGIPHITAANELDLAYAQGFVTAQDRLWQMDMIRRIAAGDLAEILGAKYIDHDKRQRYLQIRHTAEVAVAHLDPETKNIFDAYSRGVNASIASTRSHLPLEFKLLRYQPRDWSATDSILAGLNMAQMLNETFEADLKREKVEARVPPDIAHDLYPTTFWRDHPPGVEKPEIKDDTPPPVVPEANSLDPDGWIRRAGIAPPGCECIPGSNDWVVNALHSTTGKPLLSNDMHLGISVPGIWYEAHLKTNDGLDVIGVTLPGMPYVLVGHNERIAWGFTNLGPDVQDLFVEDAALPAVETRHEVIQVAKSKPVSVDVEITRHGPILTPILPGETRRIALQWTAYDADKGFRFVFPKVNRARNWQEFTAAFSEFSGPGQNVAYGDVDGNIGYHATGLVPIRATGDGSVPVPDDGTHDWTGYIPFDKLPWYYNPPSGMLATANSRVTPDDYPFLITTEWLSPYRTERIYQLLNSKPQLSVADMLAIQDDVQSPVEKFFADRFTYAIDHTGNSDKKMKDAADILRNWDGRMDIDSAAARIERLSRAKLLETLLRAKLGNDYTLYSNWGSTAVLENIVNRQPARWLPTNYSDW